MAASGVDTRFSRIFFGPVPEIFVALDLPSSMVDGRITREMVRGSMVSDHVERYTGREECNLESLSLSDKVRMLLNMIAQKTGNLSEM